MIRHQRPHRRLAQRRLALEPLEPRWMPTTFTVMSAADSGTGSLRDAITQLDADNGTTTDTIDFAIGQSGVPTISLLSALPTITHAVVIDGTTQTGLSGTPGIELNGAGAGAGASGLVVNAGGTTIKGLAINRFSQAGILLEGAGGGTIVGNDIGTDPTGSTAEGNGTGIIVQSPQNTIGGIFPSDKNVISGNAGHGIAINGAAASANLIVNDFIGVNALSSRALPNGADGVSIQGASFNTVGGTSSGTGNVISGNGAQGVEIAFTPPPPPSKPQSSVPLGASSEGLTLTPAAIAAGFSLSTFASGFPERGDGLGPYGVSFPASGGVLVDDGPGNVRRFPTDTDGQLASNNPPVAGATYGTSDAEGMGRVGNTLYMNLGQLNEVAQINDDGTINHIVTNITNADAMAVDPLNGHFFVSAFNGAIYDVDPVARTATLFLNVPSDGLAFDAQRGILYDALYSAAGPGNEVQGYDIATKAKVFDSGTIAGGPDGIALGTGSLAGNLFVNTNGGRVVEVNLATNAQTLIASGGSRGDFVTVDPNNGTLLVSQSDQLARLTPPASGGFNGGSQASGNVVEGNRIGTIPDTSAPVGNGANGVLIQNADGNTVGGTAAGAGNSIGFNAGNGVRVLSGIDNAIESNSIFSNSKLGIDLVGGTENSFGVTANSPGGPHTGPNNLQNYPVLTSAVVSNGSTSISGTFNSTPNQTFRIEFFSSPSPDPSGSGQGQTFLGSKDVPTDSSGNASFSFQAPSDLTGQFISATATDPAGNTSEFASDVTPSSPQTTTTVSSSLNPSTVGQPVTFTAIVTAAPSSVVPTGTVTFTIDGVAQPPATLSLVGPVDEATITVPNLTAGSHTITAQYNGTTGIPASPVSSPLQQVVNAAGQQTVSLALTVSPTTTTVGQPVTLTAAITSSGPSLPPPGEIVTFLDHGAVLGTAPIDSTGHASITVTTLGPGTHPLSASFPGDATFAPATSQTVNAVITTVAAPTVTGVQRFGFHLHPTTLVLSFSSPLDATSAQNVAAYRIVALGADGQPERAIAINAAVYDPTTQTVTLHPHSRLRLTRTYELTAFGTGPSAITSASGVLLDGANNGQPGSDFVTDITRANLVLDPKPRSREPKPFVEPRGTHPHAELARAHRGRR